MTRVCLVKQNTTYDLYKQTGPDLRSIVESSNFRSGPIGLWEAFDCDFRVLEEDPSPECQYGRRTWAQYVEGWDIWPSGLSAQRADNVDWARYDAVISIDIAVPTRIVLEFPTVLWCYYWIEGGPQAIKTFAKGSPFFAYNVFISQGLAKGELRSNSGQLRRMLSTKRAVLDAPYFLQSSRSIQLLYASEAAAARNGLCLSDHSSKVVSTKELRQLDAFGTVRMPIGPIRDVLRAKCTRSTLWSIQPAPRAAGTRSSRRSQRDAWWLLHLDSSGVFRSSSAAARFRQRPRHARSPTDVGEHPQVFARELAAQRARVDAWCFSHPCQNLERALDMFRQSTASPSRQRWAETRARVSAGSRRLPRRLGHRLLRGS